MGKTPPRRSLRQGPVLRTEIDKYIPALDEMIGVYCFGYKNDKFTFIPKYVGRSTDHQNGLNGRIHDYDGDPPRFADWPLVKHEFCTTVKGAFELECQVFHDWQHQLVNAIHPARPEGEDWPCPVGGDECFTESS